MKPRISLRQSLQDPNLLGGALTGESWAAWRTLLVASMGESLTEDERATFRALTGREREPLQRVDQFAAVIGRRGGKSRAMATLACTLQAYASTPTRWCLVSAASCSAWRSISEWRRSSSTTQRLPSNAVRS